MPSIIQRSFKSDGFTEACQKRRFQTPKVQLPFPIRILHPFPRIGVFIGRFPLVQVIRTVLGYPKGFKNFLGSFFGILGLRTTQLPKLSRSPMNWSNATTWNFPEGCLKASTTSLHFRNGLAVDLLHHRLLEVVVSHVDVVGENFVDKHDLSAILQKCHLVLVKIFQFGGSRVVFPKAQVIHR